MTHSTFVCFFPTPRPGTRPKRLCNFVGLEVHVRHVGNKAKDTSSDLAALLVVVLESGFVKAGQAKAVHLVAVAYRSFEVRCREIFPGHCHHAQIRPVFLRTSTLILCHSAKSVFPDQGSLFISNQRPLGMGLAIGPAAHACSRMCDRCDRPFKNQAFPVGETAPLKQFR